MTPSDIIAILGAITGSLSLIIISYKSITDKPKLSFDIDRKFFMQPSKYDNFTTISIQLKAHNKGTKSTTIHGSELSFTYKGQKRKLDSDSSLSIPDNATNVFYPNFNLRKDELRISGQIESCVLTITHTHGKKKVKLETIKELE